MRLPGAPSPEGWRATFQGYLASVETPEKLHIALVDGIQARLWASLTDAAGQRFRTFKSFCEAPEPFGLGTPHARVETALKELLGERASKLAMVAPGRQGTRSDLATSDPGGPKSGMQEKRLRAIAERAPQAIKVLYERGLISSKDAAKFGRVDGLDPAQAEFLRFAEEVVSSNVELPRDIVAKALATMKLRQRTRLAPLMSGVLTLEASSGLAEEVWSLLPCDLAALTEVIEHRMPHEDDVRCRRCRRSLFLQAPSGVFTCASCPTEPSPAGGELRDLSVPWIFQHLVFATVDDLDPIWLGWWDAEAYGRAPLRPPVDGEGNELLFVIEDRVFVIGVDDVDHARMHLWKCVLSKLAFAGHLVSQGGRYLRTDGTEVMLPTSAVEDTSPSTPFDATDMETFISNVAAMANSPSLAQMLAYAAKGSDPERLLPSLTGMFGAAVTYAAAGDDKPRLLATMKRHLGDLVDLLDQVQ